MHEFVNQSISIEEHILLKGCWHNTESAFIPFDGNLLFYHRDQKLLCWRDGLTSPLLCDNLIKMKYFIFSNLIKEGFLSHKKNESGPFPPHHISIFYTNLILVNIFVTSHTHTFLILLFSAHQLSNDFSFNRSRYRTHHKLAMQ